jgi:hypothetical protein
MTILQTLKAGKPSANTARNRFVQHLNGSLYSFARVEPAADIISQILFCAPKVTTEMKST